MKRLRRIITKVFGLIYHFSLFVIVSWKNRNKSIYIFDLDNTLGDTFPTLINRNPNEIERLKLIKPFAKVCSLANDIAHSPSRSVFVLTARQFNTRGITVEWVKNVGISIPENQIFLVLSPMQKIWLLRVTTLFCKRITFIDDMSFNHEKGEVKYYQDAIRNIPKSVHYIGYSTILSFQKK
jgi:hypothetical protein